VSQEIQTKEKWLVPARTPVGLEKSGACHPEGMRVLFFGGGTGALSRNHNYGRVGHWSFERTGIGRGGGVRGNVIKDVQPQGWGGTREGGWILMGYFYYREGARSGNVEMRTWGEKG